MFAQTSAIMVAASSTAALPLSVLRNRLSGVSRRQVQSVLPESEFADDEGVGAWAKALYPHSIVAAWSATSVCRLRGVRT